MKREAAQRSQLESILKSAPAMIAMYVGPELTCVFANPAAIGDRAGEPAMVGKTAVELGAGSQALGIMAEVRRSGESVTLADFRLAKGWLGRETDEERSLHLIVQPTRGTAGEVDGVLVFAIDTTEQMRFKREVELFAAERARLLENERAARDAAEAANRTKDEFLATVSHELRTPLNAILGWTVIARRHAAAGTELDRALSTIERNAQAQTHIIEDVLDISRMTSGKLRMSIGMTAVSDALDAAVQSVRSAAEAKGVMLHVAIDASVGAIPADADRLRQVVSYLLSNAIKFTPKAGRVALSASRSQGQVVIRVSDTGQGIRREFLPHLFEPFRQADGGTTRRQGGLGLGLAIVQRLVQAHGGRITALSDGEARGSTFFVELPAESEAPRPVPVEIARDEHAHVTRLDGLRLLVVDDDADAREMLERVLADQGALVLRAESAAVALQILEESRPNVVLSDIAMPAMDGYELVRKMRRLPAAKGGRTPAIALTACTRNEDVEHAIRAGFQAHLSKPVHVGSLMSTIASVAKTVPPSSKPQRSQRARR